MATRATYKFGSRLGITTVIYNHWDGYPEGAAEHLQGVRTAEDFLRKNENSEITESHELHGDTEYRYNIEAIKPKNTLGQVTIAAFKRVNFTEKWEQFFYGTSDEFAAKYLQKGAA